MLVVNEWVRAAGRQKGGGEEPCLCRSRSRAASGRIGR